MNVPSSACGVPSVSTGDSPENATRNAFARIAVGIAAASIATRIQDFAPAAYAKTNARKASGSRYRIPSQASTTEMLCPATFRILPSRTTMNPAVDNIPPARRVARSCNGSVIWL